MCYICRNKNKKFMSAETEMPKFKSTKEVWALKIEKIEVLSNGNGIITPEEPFAPFEANDVWMKHNKPKTGDYYVQHENGKDEVMSSYKFENGYIKIQK